MRTRRDSNPAEMPDPAGKWGQNTGEVGKTTGDKYPKSGPVDTSRGHLAAGIEGLRAAIASPLLGKLRRLTAAANDVVTAWDRGAA